MTNFIKYFLKIIKIYICSYKASSTVRLNQINKNDVLVSSNSKKKYN